MPAPIEYLLAIDQGTTSSRAVIYNSQLRECASAQMEFPQYFPQEGWVEHDPEEIWESVVGTVRAAIERARIPASSLAGVGITNQRETTVVWERASGRAVAPAIVWQDRRTGEMVERLKSEGCENLVREKTGLVMDPYFSSTKLAWLLENVPGLRVAAEAGELAAGTVESWLIFRLTGGRVHVSDITNASRTQLMDLESGNWSDELLKLFGIPHRLLPHIVPNVGGFGFTDENIFGASIPIVAAVGDQQSALFGQMCHEPGMVKCTYGTGCFLLAFAGEKRPRSRHRLLETVAWRLPGGPVHYALEGSVFVGGAAIQWLRDGLKLISSAPEVNALAATADPGQRPVFVPSFTGLGAPYWEPSARGAMFGLTRATSGAELAMATLEGIALQVADVVLAMRRDLGHRLRRMRVDGGASASDLLLQFQADILGISVERPACVESTALGAAMMAGLGAGLFRSTRDIAHIRQSDTTFKPAMSARERKCRLARWRKALRLVKQWS
jgi:glycerol kinase